MFKLLSGALLALALTAMVTPAGAQSGQITFLFTNNTSYTLYARFFSHKRKAVWPSSTTAYTLADRRQYTIVLSCQVQELVCYGAFWKDESKQWGVGAKNLLDCHDLCCTLCTPPEADKPWPQNFVD
jgi:hypothetical protein